MYILNNNYIFTIVISDEKGKPILKFYNNYKENVEANYEKAKSAFNKLKNEGKAVKMYKVFESKINNL